MDNLVYPKELVSFYIADDGSTTAHHREVIDCISDYGFSIIGSHNQKFRREGQEGTYNAGMGWNYGLGICYQNTDFVLVLEDDWELNNKLDISPYINLLTENENVGICTFRILSIGADVHTTSYKGEIYLRYDRTTQYAYSGNPHIRHARYTKYYGWFDEERNPGMIELNQDDLYRYVITDPKNPIPRKEGPEIWRPFGIDQWGAWKHIGSEKSWE